MLVAENAVRTSSEMPFHTIPTKSMTKGSATQPTNITSKSVGVLLPAISRRMTETVAPMIEATTPVICSFDTAYGTASSVFAALPRFGIGTSIETSRRYSSYASP